MWNHVCWFSSLFQGYCIKNNLYTAPACILYYSNTWIIPLWLQPLNLMRQATNSLSEKAQLIPVVQHPAGQRVWSVKYNQYLSSDKFVPKLHKEFSESESLSYRDRFSRICWIRIQRLYSNFEEVIKNPSKIFLCVASILYYMYASY